MSHGGPLLISRWWHLVQPLPPLDLGFKRGLKKVSIVFQENFKQHVKNVSMKFCFAATRAKGGLVYSHIHYMRVFSTMLSVFPALTEATHPPVEK